jgi:pilus assembly protein Flp/PilA
MAFSRSFTFWKDFSRSLPAVNSQENQMSAIFHNVIKDESGVTAIEYGLIAALIAVVIIGALTTLGGSLSTLFTGISNSL